MSRVGKLPVSIPSGVTVQVADGAVSVRGPKGNLSQALVDHVDVEVTDGHVAVTRHNNARQSRANHGLMRSLVANMVHGVSQGFQKQLEVIGVGYRADVRGKQLVMNLGYSHPVNYDIPDGVDISVDKQNVITIDGIDKQQVGHVAAEIRSWRRPDAYKGKGVRYKDERISLKAGKSAK
ncbi:MAG: 50S ribosomal protein L6 [Myxococcales bacterium]|nr:50S ribosomal protein L6 [Myxococcales bacterium]